MDSEEFTGVAANTSSGFVLPDLLGSKITSVSITSQTNDPNVDGYDFLIDSVAFNESINQELNVTPEPSSLLLMGTGALGLAGAAVRRRRRLS